MSRLTAIKSVDLEAVDAAANAERQQVPSEPIGQQFATEMLMTALKALSQRAAIALSNLFTLLTVASAFYLWAMALPQITVLQIVGLSIYSAFILLINTWGRRK